MNHIQIIEVVVEARKGVSIGNAIQEAVLLCAQEWRRVRLLFNMQEYVVEPNDLFAACREVEG